MTNNTRINCVSLATVNLLLLSHIYHQEKEIRAQFWNILFKVFIQMLDIITIFVVTAKIKSALDLVYVEP